ncbi:MAG TPA: methylenetetrahydrofolate--tRNA-(uracil(54)-C(5))-methyltransferase (FADH(2)-oxidizing) TrmFO, partial [Clostridiaceae bacterium]|nr:methylenetetrahydrofolate--tRNA-(uracil(54)-C(5))-methyltransferase (FADH(2)-oxidizing) TrmFO [Clostridiaceae bacterium]
MNENAINVIGAGLAGSEAALQIARLGVPVRLIDMKPGQYTPAHKNPNFGELVCSNSLRGAALENAVGLLKEELRRLGSVLIEIADRCQVPAGGALAVDRNEFAAAITATIKQHPLIDVREEKVTHLPKKGINIIATGPLTEGDLFSDITTELGIDELHFFDAAAPIITDESINYNIVFRQSRYDKGDADYLNCPMDKDTYDQFWQALINAELAKVHDFDKETIFEGCMPVEVMAERGPDTLRYGPLKPVGLLDPKTGKTPYAVVQLRQDNK